MTVEDFALKMFRIDLKEGLFERFDDDEDDEDQGITCWDNLPEDEKKLYRKEAAHYMTLPKEDWINFEFYGETSD